MIVQKSLKIPIHWREDVTINEKMFGRGGWIGVVRDICVMLKIIPKYKNSMKVKV